MSNADVIEAVSTALSASIATALDIRSVGVRALQDAEKADLPLNLWLYQILPNPSRMGVEPPWKPGAGRGAPPLALSLRYLLTTRSDQADGHRHLGRAMLYLHENSAIRLDPPEVAYVTLLPLTVDELEKIWAGVQSPRRLSVAYNVDLVVLESLQPAPSPLPVLRRNIVVMPGIAPSIDRLIIAGATTDGRSGRRATVAAEIGDGLQLETNASAVKAIVKSALYRSEIEIRPNGTDTFPVEGGWVHVVLDRAVAAAVADRGPPRFIAGPNTMSLQVAPRAEHQPGQRTNEVPFMLVPTPDFPEEAVSPGEEIVVDSDPPPMPEQSVALVVGDAVVKGRVKDGRMYFTVPSLDVETRSYPARLRIDGAESFLKSVPAEAGQPEPSWEPSISVVGTGADNAGPGDVL